MTKLVTFVFIILGLTQSSSTKPDHLITRKANPTLRISNSTLLQRQEDFDLLRKAITEAHSGLYRFSDSGAIHRRFDYYRSQLSTVTNQPEFISLLSAMLAETRDGHMRLEYDRQTVAQLSQARLFPFQVMIEDRKLMVMYNESAMNKDIVPGMELLTINGRNVSELVAFMMGRVSGDGYIQTGKKRRLERNFAQLYWLFVNQSDAFTITAQTVTGQQVTTQVEGVQSSERLANRSRNPVNRTMLETFAQLDDSKENISLRFVDSQPTASLKIREFEGERFTVQLDSAFSLLNEKKIRTLVLDLRGNGGGVDEYGAALVSHFTNRPFRYFDRIWMKTIAPSFATWKPQTFEIVRKGTKPAPGGYLVTTDLHSGVGEQQPAKQVFGGAVYVLLDGRTFSTAADVTAILSAITKSVFIGEESGGTREGNTSGLSALIKLPHSGIGLKIHLYGYWNALPDIKKGRGQLPDYFVETNTSDLLAGKDKQLTMAVNLAKEVTK